MRNRGRLLAFNPDAYLKSVADFKDHEIDLARAALALAMAMKSDIMPEKYLHHIERLIADVRSAYDARIEIGGVDGAELRLSVLKSVLHEMHEYCGDIETYDHIDNASLVRVIDRRQGMPIALALLYIHVGRAQGWDVWGLNMPGHFLCRIDYGTQRIVFDPFHACREVDAADMRFIVKQALGAEEELSPSYYEPYENRRLLIRLQNNIKHRQIELEDDVGALRSVQVMQMIAPNDYRLCLDAGILYARHGQAQDAIENLSRYIDSSPSPQDRHDAMLLLEQVRDTL